MMIFYPFQLFFCTKQVYFLLLGNDIKVITFYFMREREIS